MEAQRRGSGGSGGAVAYRGREFMCVLGGAPLDSSLDFFFLWSLVVYLCIAWMLCVAPLSSPNWRQLAGRETQMRTG